jgi:hypothetical protein
MIGLVLFCLVIGLAPALVSKPLGLSVESWAGGSLADLSLNEVAPVGWISAASAMLLTVIVVVGFILATSISRSAIHGESTWGCGYRTATPRMQYTSSSFGQMLVDMFAWLLRPSAHRPNLRSLFPSDASYYGEMRDVVLDRVMVPAFRWSARVLGWFRVLQQGSIQAYLLYIMLALLMLFLWESF